MKETAEEKMKAPAQKGPIVQKGRFSVTSDDVDCEVSTFMNLVPKLNWSLSILHEPLGPG